MKYPYGLQLYSVRDKFEGNVAGALDAVKAAGFDCVELAAPADSRPARCGRCWTPPVFGP